MDALGLGRINLTLQAGRRRYLLQDGVRLAAQVRPLVDGSGFRIRWRDLVLYLQEKLGAPAGISCFNGIRPGPLWAGRAGACRLPADYWRRPLCSGAAGEFIPWPCSGCGLCHPSLPVRLPIRFLYPLGEKQEQVQRLSVLQAGGNHCRGFSFYPLPFTLRSLRQGYYHQHHYCRGRPGVEKEGGALAGDAGAFFFRPLFRLQCAGGHLRGPAGSAWRDRPGSLSGPPVPDRVGAPD